MAETIEIKKRQLDAGIRNQEIALEYGCSKQFVSMVILGVRRSRKLEAYIARRLGARVDELFPRDRHGISRFLRRVDDVAREASNVAQLGPKRRPNPLDLKSIIRYLPSTWGQVLHRAVEDPLARAVMSQVWPYVGLGPSEASFFYFALTLRTLLVNGPCYIKGR